MIFLLIAAGIFAADCGIKYFINRPGSRRFPGELFGGRIRLALHRNYGLMMNRLQEHPGLSRRVSGIVFLAAAVYYLPCFFRRKVSAVKKLGAALLLGGAGGNLFDRFRRGYVTDYLSLRLEPVRKIIFNLADIFIFAGLFLLLLAEIFRRPRRFLCLLKSKARKSN